MKRSQPMLLLLCAAAPAQAGWTKLPFPADNQAALAFDSARGRTVLFGGSLYEPFGATWEWDGAAWLQRRPATRPPGRSHHAMAFDSARGKVVLFGGSSSATSRLADTWEWDGQDWVDKTPALGPTGRYDHALAYDSVRQRTVLFGAASTSAAQTWEWDGSAWTAFTPPSSPSDRIGTALAFDPLRQRIVLFGGYSFVTGLLGDTWEWDGSTWTQMQPASAPLPRQDHGMAYDAARGRVVLYGVLNANSVLSDLWVWYGNTWVQQSMTPGPGPRSSPALAHDSLRQRLVLYGGQGNGTAASGTPVFGDLWELDLLGRWQSRAASALPSDLGSWPLVHDVARGVVVGFSGPSARTWTWDGWSWRLLAPAASPPARTGFALAHDLLRQRTVLFGGVINFAAVAETWEWDGSTWSMRTPAQSPPARAGHALAYDLARQRVVLFGGGNSVGTGLMADTWEWDGATWTQRPTTARPSARAAHKMSYDLRRQRTVLFGGYEAALWPTDTWEWDGNAWSLVPAAAAPAGRIRHGLAYDPSRGRTVLFGGDAFGETWEWSGAAWAKIGGGPGPYPALDVALAWDGARGAVLLAAGNAYENESWLFGNVVPSAVSTFGSGCAGSAGVPRLAGGLPSVGNQGLALDLLGAAGLVPCGIVVAFQTQSVALGGGCSLYVADPTVPFVLTTSAIGFASARLAVPADPSIRGTLAYAQAVALDPLGAFAGLAFTGGLRLTVGD